MIRADRPSIHHFFCLVLTLAGLPAAGADTGTVGRVKLTEVRSEEGARRQVVLDALRARFAPAAGAAADVRLLSLRAGAAGDERYEATIYDYRVERAFNVVLDKSGAELSRKETALGQDVSEDELADAMKIVAANPAWSAGVADGTYELYPAMPGVTRGADGRRLVNVGVVQPRAGRTPRFEGTGMSPPTGPDALANEVLSVSIATGQIVQNASGAPDTSMATLFACGPNTGTCSASTGTCPSVYHLEWPQPNPKWKLDIWHPACTTSIQSQGTGLEIQNVYYDGKLILKDAGVPVLNVLYDNNACGPYRDWLYSEYCMQATGVDAPAPGSGFRVTTGNPAPTTLCESGVDGGNYKGVAIHDAGAYLLLSSQTSAGWYRYVMEWRLYLDGTIEPVFGFGATLNSCTCNPHSHHAYWRFEFALDGDASIQTSGVNTIDRLVAGTTDQWTPITTEGKFTRPTTDPGLDWWRVRNPSTNTTYVIKPGGKDGSAAGDSYAKGDYWVLAYNAGEINDPNTDTSINIDPWVNGEAIGASKRLVLWYAAGWRHDVPGGDTQACEVVGPRLEYSQPCAGTITLDKGAYGCADSIGITLRDSDLQGTGAAAVTVQSTTEPTPESVQLTENPAGSGAFTGSFPTTSNAASPGDGKLSVTHGDSISVRYLDVSSCGTPNVTVEKLVSADCQPPSITNVQVSAVTDTTATISWTTDEPADSRVTYGATVPPANVLNDSTHYGATHSLDLSGLASCTTERFSVSSADIAGNRTTADAGGGYYSFTTAARAFAAGPDDVESGSPQWTPTGPAGTVWHIDACKASSPTHAWKAGAAAGTCPGTYGGGADTYLTSPVFGFGLAGHGYHLRYKEYYATEAGFDICTPQVSVDGGTSWANLASYSGASNGWVQKDYDLSAYSGAAVRLRFWFHTDASTQDEGWYIDDIDVSRVSSCSAELRWEGGAVTDSCPAGGAGDGNAVLDPGENAVLTVTASNLGISPATGVTATLTTSTPGVTVTRATASLPDIPVRGAVTTMFPHFAFSVGSGVPCGTLAAFVATFHANEGTWSSAFTISVGAGAVGATTYNSTDVPKPIPDNTTTTSTITAPPAGTITDVNVGVTLLHTYDSDLTLTLVAPNAQTVLLSNRRGGSGDNYTNTVFDDKATTPISSGSPPFTGSFQPEAPLAALSGLPVAGLWTLRVTDSATADTGTISAWSLTIDAVTPPVCTACAVSAPAEAAALNWAAGSVTALEWGPVFGAGWYTVYQGAGPSLPGLTSPAVDSCTAWAGTGATTGKVLTATPPAGGVLWYLVTASNGAGEGSAGAGAGGPRIVNSSGTCP